MEFKEIRRKDGKVLVFCKFTELLLDFYGVPSMDEVEPFATPGGEYIIHCPFCKNEGHTKHKLYIKTDLTVGNCFVCDRAYVNVVDEVDTKVRLDNFMIPAFTGLQLERLSDPVWSLDSFHNEFDDFDQGGYDYLIGRHQYMDVFWKLLDFKFVDGNVVMPFKYHGEVFYYQIRFTGNSSIKYYFPPIAPGKKPPYIIEHGENKKFIICEGVYDAIALLLMAPEYTPMAVLGSCITDYQLQFLREYVPSKILVYMDETKISNKIARKIVSQVDYCPIGIIKSWGEDPEEKMKKILRSGGELQWIK